MHALKEDFPGYHPELLPEPEAGLIRRLEETTTSSLYSWPIRTYLAINTLRAIFGGDRKKMSEMLRNLREGGVITRNTSNPYIMGAVGPELLGIYALYGMYIQHDPNINYAHLKVKSALKDHPFRESLTEPEAVMKIRTIQEEVVDQYGLSRDPFTGYDLQALPPESRNLNNQLQATQEMIQGKTEASDWPIYLPTATRLISATLNFNYGSFCDLLRDIRRRDILQLPNTTKNGKPYFFLTADQLGAAVALFVASRNLERRVLNRLRPSAEDAITMLGDSRLAGEIHLS